MQKQRDLLIGKGETLDVDYINWKDEAGSLVDLTGHSVTLVVYPKTGANIGTYPFTLSLGNATLTVDDSVTATWPVGVNGYRVEHQDPAGHIRWINVGRLTVKSGRDW